jgi:CRP-like cAMP-binding protein
MTRIASAVPKHRTDGRIVKNLLLATLSEAEFATLRPFLKSVELRRKEEIQQQGKPAENVYFIESGIVSRVVQTPSNGPMETAMVGCYGLIGASVVLGLDLTLQRAIVQLPGRALRIGADDLSRVMQENPSVREHLLQYISILLMMKAQISLCNAKHDTIQRTARWLQCARDRLDTNRLMLTQSTLASMLGVQRKSVATALKRLESLGLVQHQERGFLSITTPDGLKQSACECYRIIDERWASLKAMKRHAHRIDAPSDEPGSARLQRS